MSDTIRTDNLTPSDRKRTMQRVHGVDTKPEMVVRRMLYSMGYRYRLHRHDLPGKPDIVLVSRRKVIFVHGCFWHGHTCKAGNKSSKTNTDYWLQKIESNCQRDQKCQSELKALGWKTLVVWECEIKDSAKVQLILSQFLE